MLLSGGFAGAATFASAQTPLCSGLHPGNPQLISGAASCLYNEIGGAGQTLINLSQDSVIRWDHLGLSNPNATLEFQYTGAGGNPIVLNRITGSNSPRGTIHNVAGSVEFNNGQLVILNPNSELLVQGNIVADRIVLSTHDLDPIQQAEFLMGNEADFTGATKMLTVSPSGRIEAMSGDVVLSGKNIQLQGTDSEVISNGGSVRAYAGDGFKLKTGGLERVEGLPGSGSGVVRNFRTVRARNVVEFHGTTGVENGAGGLVEADMGAGRIFLRVDNGAGDIRNDGELNAFVTSDLPPVGTGGIKPNEGDALSAVSTGISRFPKVRAPGEKASSSKQVVVYEQGPTTGSASAQRDRATETRTGRSRSSVAKNQPLARGRSFFGLRGGSSAKKKKGR